MSYGLLVSGDCFNITLPSLSRVFQVYPEHPAYTKILSVLKDKTATEDLLAKLYDEGEESVVRTVSFYDGFNKSGLQIKGEDVTFNGEEVPGCIGDRILKYAELGLPLDSMVKFLTRLYKNPSYTAIQELYDFLQYHDLAILEDGRFAAYKAVRENWFDKYSGKIDNSPGKVISMDRSKVDDNRSIGCSKGLHCGSIEYASSYGGSNCRMLIVAVDPADVVSVPTDCACKKCRVCKYEVLREYTGVLNKSPVYSEDSSKPVGYISPQDFNIDDIDFDDDEYEDDYYYDDYYDDDDVTVEDCRSCNCDTNDKYGVKPSGQKYWNVRKAGKFAKVA